MQGMMRSHVLRRLTASATVVSLLACGGQNLVLPTDGAPGSESSAHLQMASGNQQAGAPGAALAQPVSVRLVGDSGQGIADREVTWIVSTGNGTVTPETAMTDHLGYASTSWTLGDPGPNSLTAV